MRALAALLLFSLGCASAPLPAPQPKAPALDLPHRTVRLENGLTLVMQPDASMPQVGVEVWIRGGAREEAAGQFGIAHLFEHNVPSSGRFLGNPENRARRAAAARQGGAGTQFDFLRFYGTATPDGLEPLLGYSADRLESDPAKFNEEAVKRDHDIVVSELRRAMNIDWDLDVSMHLARGTFGAGHPYGHSISGTEADVRSATAETMRDWHRRFSGAANAIVFVAGNFDPVRAEALVRHHFGSIPPGIRTPRVTEWVPDPQARHDLLEKDVQREVTYLRWPIPGWGTEDAEYLTLLGHIFEATTRVELFEMAGAFTLRGESETALRAEMEKILRDGITDAQLARARARHQSAFVRMLQRPVWRGSRADVLGFGLMWRGDSEHYKKQLAWITSATPAQVTAAARRWLDKPAYVLQVVPRTKYAAAPPIDRAASIEPAEQKPVEFPAVESTVENGVRLLRVRRDSLPLVQLTWAFDPGADVEALRNSIAEPLADLGAEVTSGRDADFATLSVSALSEHVQAVTSIVAGAKVPVAVPATTTTPMERREHALECLIGDCETKHSSTTLRTIIASGDIGPFDGKRANAHVPPGPGQAGLPVLHHRPAPEREHFEIIDYPGATQAYILLAQILPPAVAKDPLAAQLVVSHAFRSRLMDNLRSAKGWSYEIYPFGVELWRGGALARFNIPVQSDKTGEAIQEIRKEIYRLRDEPVSPEFLASTRSYLETTLTSGLLALDELNEQLLEIPRNDLPEDYFATALRRLQTFTPADVQRTARELFTPDRLIWIIAGERAVIESELREIGAQ